MSIIAKIKKIHISAFSKSPVYKRLLYLSRLRMPLPPGASGSGTGSGSTPPSPEKPETQCPNSRVFNCALCKRQAVICEKCDKGHIYCSDGCRKEARRQKRRKANQDYYKTEKGKENNVERQRRYRERKQKGNIVTDRGSLPLTFEASSTQPEEPKSLNHCHFCGQRVSDYRKQEN